MNIAVGDKVSYYGHEAIVVAIIPGLSTLQPTECKIEFFDKGLIPPTMKVPLRSLFIIPEYEDEFDMFELENEAAEMLPKGNQRLWIDPEKDCPECNTPWTETKFGDKSWYDCLPCGKTKEAILSKKPI